MGAKGLDAMMFPTALALRQQLWRWLHKWSRIQVELRVIFSTFWV